MLKKVIATLSIIMLAGIQSPVMADNHGEPPVQDLENKFEVLLFPETDGTKVTNYDSIHQLEEDLNSIMKFPLTDYYLEKYFYEKDGDLHIRAMDGAYLVDLEQDYTLEKLSDDHYRLTQNRSNQLRGEFTVQVDYSFEAGKWVFEDRMDVVGSQEGGELPNTATNMPLMMLSGGLLMAAGAFLIYRKRHTTE